MTREPVSFWLPFPVSVNNMFPHRVVDGRARRFPSRAYSNWRKVAGLMLNAKKLSRFDEPVVIKLQYFPANRRARDLDNLSKGVLDALVAARILHDDSSKWVKAVTGWMEEPDGHARVVVTIRVAELALFKAAGAAA
jgi:crossover junction endodeoxyribonuclease RusA